MSSSWWLKYFHTCKQVVGIIFLITDKFSQPPSIKWPLTKKVALFGKYEL